MKSSFIWPPPKMSWAKKALLFAARPARVVFDFASDIRYVIQN